MAKQSSHSAILGLDIGAARIGVAVAGKVARLPRPVAVIPHTTDVFARLKDLADTEQASLIVIGLPRNMEGLETVQTEAIREFAGRLQSNTGLEVAFAEESLSTRRAEQTVHGYRSTAKDKHLDDVAACFILEAYFEDGGQKL